MRLVVNTTEKVGGYITAEDIRKAFGLPDNAKISFMVPGGGDWSNMEIEIDRDNPVYVQYERTDGGLII